MEGTGARGRECDHQCLPEWPPIPAGFSDLLHSYDLSGVLCLYHDPRVELLFRTLPGVSLRRTKKVVRVYRWIYILAVFIGPYMTVEAVWNIADVFNGLMAFPNLIAILALSGVISRETKDYFKRQKELKNAG